jgi:hypothetical protein
MKESKPGMHSLLCEPWLCLKLTNVLRKDDVDGNDVCIKAIDSGAVNEIVPETPQMGVDASPDVIRGEPPEKIEKMRARQFRNSMPNEMWLVQVFYVLAIDVDLKLVR